ncbi:15787_t:CDS:2 [Acaulospora colombiana]|uniref:15787_t:CDS:1 n=1 Tax=Acaulospora colombiana TaxID=27376 RepID=A0ACA9NCL5_9GLOM|nr:15787_t:CDS:2 [Acaulospora colombiana]
MVWNSQKKLKDLEKGSDLDSISSFGSVHGKGFILAPKQAHLAPSPPSPTYPRTGTDSRFTKSLPTSEKEPKMRSFVRRHAFLIFLAVALILVCTITAIGVLLKARTRNSPIITPDQLTAGGASDSVATLTATLR